MPMAGASLEPAVAACTKSVPIIGPVQEKDTKASVKAIKKILSKPVVESALLSSLLVQDDGNTSSNAPKKEIAKTTNSRKNMMLKTAFVAKLFRELTPKIPVMSKPSTT